jgi:hypothetical protein
MTSSSVIFNVAYVTAWLFFYVIWSTIMGNSRPFLSLIVQQATLFAVLIGLGRLVSPLTDQLPVPQEVLGFGTIIVSEILVFKRAAHKLPTDDLVDYGIQLTIAAPIGFVIAFLTGGGKVLH